MRENTLKQRHFGVLIPSTNTTVEMECRLLPTTYQAHFGRLMSSGAGSFSPSRDEDIDYQSRLLGTARVEMVILAQTSASLFAEDYDDVVTKRMGVGAGVPAITSAQAVGRAVRALGARRVAIVSPYSDAVNERAARYFKTKYGLDTIALGDVARPTRMRSAGSAHSPHAMHSPGSIGRRSRSSWCPAAISRRCPRWPPGSENSRNPW